MWQDLGWSRADIGFVTILTAIAALVLVPAAGWLIDRVSLRPIVLTAVVGQAVVIAAGSQLGGSVWNFYIQVFFLMVFGTGASVMTLSKIVRGWFDQSLGKAMGILFAIASAGGIINPLLAQELMTRLGWRDAYLALGMIGLVITALVAFFMIEENAKPDINSAVLEAVATPASDAKKTTAIPIWHLLQQRQWLILAVYCVLFGYAVSGIGFHKAALMQDRGASLAQSALAVSLGAAGGMLGNLVAGWLIDRFSARFMACAVMVVPMIGMLMLLTSTDVLLALTAAFLFGLSTGSEGSLIAVLVGRFFKPEVYGRIYASLAVATSIGSSVAPSIVGLMQERSGNYTSALYVAVIAFSLAALVGLFLPRGSLVSSTANAAATDRPSSAAGSGGA
jgi:MFS family permease